MRNEFLRRVRPLISPGDTVVCALSGGADSVTMTHLFFSLRQELGITVLACHFNHGLRGAESDGDESFCRDLCARWGIPLAVGRGDVARRAKETGESLEEAARHCRYAFFAKQSGLVATAHTADDQLETVLLHLVRGTGLKGLAGIPPVRGNVIRPMLGFSRREILAYLDAENLPHREDSTNGQDDCLRNRIRHHVVPLLKEENPALLRGVSHMTQTLRNDEALLSAMAEKLLSDDGEAGYAVNLLRSAPPSQRQRAVRQMLRQTHAPKLTAAHIRAVENLILSDDPSAAADLPGGWRAERAYDKLLLTRCDAPASFSEAVLPCPGEAYLPELDMTVRVSRDGEGLRLPARLTEGGITVRPRKPGDRIRLNAGSRELKKLLIDRKIPAAQRDRIPVFAAGETVLAVWGIGENVDCLPRPGEDAYHINVERGDTRNHGT